MFIGDLTTRNDFVKELFSVYLVSSNSADGVIHTHGTSSRTEAEADMACGVPFRRSSAKKVKWLEGQGIGVQRLAGSSTFNRRLILMSNSGAANGVLSI